MCVCVGGGGWRGGGKVIHIHLLQIKNKLYSLSKRFKT